jgi:hypothetical protein
MREPHFRFGGNGGTRVRTPDELASYYALQQPNPEHVKILRAGIAEFRAFFANRDKAESVVGSHTRAITPPAAAEFQAQSAASLPGDAAPNCASRVLGIHSAATATVRPA